MERRDSVVDVVLFVGAFLFAVAAAMFASIPIYREWGRMAVGWYAAGAVASAILSVRRSTLRARVAVAVVVMAGAAIIPLAVEVSWRASSGPGFHAQSEAIVTEEAAAAVWNRRDPYAATYEEGPLAARPLGTKTHFPYLPGMLVFGLPRAILGRHALTDSRLAFAAATVCLGLISLRLWRGSPAPKLRAFQFLAILPTGALLMATGGDDLPVLALLLLGLVLLNEGRPVGAGLAVGLAAATKQTAWLPLVFIAVAAVRMHGRREGAKLAWASLGVAGPVILAFAAWNPAAFWEDVVLFPLGLGNQPTPAATATLGTVLIDAIPGPRALVTAILGAIVAVAALSLLMRRPPDAAAGAAGRAAAIFGLAVLLAPAARLGYVVYPIDLIAWSTALAGAGLTPRRVPVGMLPSWRRSRHRRVRRRSSR